MRGSPMDGVYRFAELNIAVRSLFRDVHDYCAEFHTDAEADFADFLRLAPDIFSEEFDFSFCRTVETVQELGERRFAAACVPDDPDDF